MIFDVFWIAIFIVILVIGFLYGFLKLVNLLNEKNRFFRALGTKVCTVIVRGDQFERILHPKNIRLLNPRKFNVPADNKQEWDVLKPGAPTNTLIQRFFGFGFYLYPLEKLGEVRINPIEDLKGQIKISDVSGATPKDTVDPYVINMSPLTVLIEMNVNSSDNQVAIVSFRIVYRVSNPKTVFSNPNCLDITISLVVHELRQWCAEESVNDLVNLRDSNGQKISAVTKKIRSRISKEETEPKHGIKILNIIVESVDFDADTKRRRADLADVNNRIMVAEKEAKVAEQDALAINSRLKQETLTPERTSVTVARALGNGNLRTLALGPNGLSILTNETGGDDDKTDKGGTK